MREKETIIEVKTIDVKNDVKNFIGQRTVVNVFLVVALFTLSGKDGTNQRIQVVLR